MKIPETSANIGAYYGNEENGQWQPNGVIVDGGVGGGVVGSGDAGYQPPIYQIPRPVPGPGYMMAGPYYEGGPPFAPQPHDDFEDYMWMENEEEFDKQVMQQLEEEALMEQCIEAMLEDEQRERQRPHNGHGPPPSSEGRSWVSLEEAVSRSTLNPLAKEFVPTTSTARPSNTASKEQIVEVSAKDDVESKPGTEPQTTNNKTQEDKPIETPPTLPPPSTEINNKKEQTKKEPPKTSADSKKKQPNVSATKSETKVPPSKDTTPKSTKSDVKLDVKDVKDVKSASSRVEEPMCPEPTPDEGPKPINYAAAARANKGKKPSPAPVIEKTPPPVTDKLPPKDKKPTEKQTVKATEKSRKTTK